MCHDFLAFRGAYDACHCLLKAGADVNSIDISFGDNRTALHKAASEGHNNIIKLLVESGADESVLDSQGKTYKNLIESSPPHEKLDCILQTAACDRNATCERGALRPLEKATLAPAEHCSMCHQVDIAFTVRGQHLLCQNCTKKKRPPFL